MEQCKPLQNVWFQQLPEITTLGRLIGHQQPWESIPTSGHFDLNRRQPNQ